MKCCTLIMLILLIMHHGLVANDYVVKNYTPFEINVSYIWGINKEKTASVKANDKFKVWLQNLKRIIISGIKISGATIADTTYFGGKADTPIIEEKIALQEAAKSYLVLSELAFENGNIGTTIPLQPKKIRFFLFYNDLKGRNTQNGTSERFNETTGLLQK